MKSKITLFGLLLLLTFGSKAQTYVTIPDSNFVAYLQTHSTCMTGNQMDLTCAQTMIYLNVGNLSITDLTGIEYCTNLQQLYCWDNLLTSIPPLPNSLESFGCSNNLLTSLPPLPNSLNVLQCDHNQLTSLPALPISMTQLYCNNNQLTSLPSLPGSLLELWCDTNNISCFSVIPNTIHFPYRLQIKANPFSCLPNYTSAMDAEILNYPLCVDGDIIHNSNGCNGSKGVSGYVFRDSINNCSKDSLDIPIANIPLKLYDSGGLLLQQTYSFANGVYNFYQPAGTYETIVDTANIAFTPHCLFPGTDTTVILSASNPLASNVNFDIGCKTGFDVGVQSVVTSGWVFPGLVHRVHIDAGDITHWFNLNCADGVSGQVQVTVSGPVSYSGAEPGTLVPVVAGNVFTYSISDFGLINNSHDFGLMFSTDTTAIAGNKICIDIKVDPLSGDNDTANNSYEFCYVVVNSYDPNMKEVYPVDVEPGYEDWLTYTIHFQNTGTAPAMNIRLADTLNTNLDLETFQVINYSHANIISLLGNSLVVRFPNIQLPDSTTDLEGSKGFIQYRIKPLPGLVAGTTISNTAFIYFDYNTAIITNTTINAFVLPLSLNESKEALSLSVYPNPNNGKFIVKLPETVQMLDWNIEVYNVLGELVLKTKAENQLSQIDLSSSPNGVYFVKAKGNGQSLNQRVIKQ